jgi:hypothetical protein
MWTMERDLSDDFKLSFRSTGEINEAFSAIVARAAGDRSIRFRNKRKAARASVLNAIVLWVAGLPAEEQRRVVREGMGLLNDCLGVEPETLPAQGQVLDVEPVAPPQPRPRNKKGA